jgi:hypothetical protein
VSGSLFDQKGIILGSDYKRLVGRINLEHQISKRVKTGAQMSYTRSLQNRINNDNNIYGVLSTAILMASDIPVRFADGSYGKDASSSTENPLAAAVEPYNLSTSGRLLGTVFAEAALIDGLKIRTNWNLDQVSFKEDRFLPNTLNAASGLNGSATATNGGELNWSTSNYLTYNRSFNNIHSISATAGADYQQSTYDFVLASSTNLVMLSREYRQVLTKQMQRRVVLHGAWYLTMAV